MIDMIKGVIVNIFEWIALGLINTSYWICLFTSIVALMLYVAGLKKAGKYVPASLIIYILLETLGMAIRSVQ